MSFACGKRLYKALTAAACLATVNLGAAAAQDRSSYENWLSTSKDVQLMASQYRAKRYILAEEIGRQILAKDPTNLDVHYLLGNVYCRLFDEKSATLQYQYCVKTGKGGQVARAAYAALVALQGHPLTANESEAKAPTSPASNKKIDQNKLRNALAILRRAQIDLVRQQAETATMIAHSQEFARSRIAEIPVQQFRRRPDVIVNSIGYRSTEQLTSAANSDRPFEIARIRAAEEEKIKKMGDNFHRKEEALVSSAMSAANALIGDTGTTPGPKTKPVEAGKTTGKPTSEQTWTRIKNSDIAFMLDMSYNMAGTIGDTGITRWEWAAGRINDFAEKVGGANGKTFTISLDAYQEYKLRDQNTTGLTRCLASARPSSPANLSTPMSNIINDYLDSHSRNPLLLLVFTTGRAETGEAFEGILKGYADRLKNPDDVRIVFVQIGDDPEGAAMLRMLDSDLTYTGARADIVDFVSFSDLQASGIASAILDACERPRSSGLTPPPPLSTVLSERIAALEKLAK